MICHAFKKNKRLEILKIWWYTYCWEIGSWNWQCFVSKCAPKLWFDTIYEEEHDEKVKVSITRPPWYPFEIFQDFLRVKVSITRPHGILLKFHEMGGSSFRDLPVLKFCSFAASKNFHELRIPYFFHIENLLAFCIMFSALKFC